MGRKTGITEEQLRGLADFEVSPHFTDDERLVLRLAVQLTRTPASVPDPLYEALRRRFSERELGGADCPYGLGELPGTIQPHL